MAAEILIPNATKKKFLDGSFDLVNDTLKGMLLTASHTTNIDTQEFADDISANEVSSSGSYTAGFGNRITLSSKTTSQDDTDDEGVFDFADIQVTSFTGSPAFLAIIKEVTDDSDSPVIAIEDFDGAVVITAGTFDYTVATEGFLNTTQQ